MRSWRHGVFRSVEVSRALVLRAVALAPAILRGAYSGMQSLLPRQTDRIRAMTADEKVRLSQTLWREAWNVAAAGVRARHPDWSAERVAERVRELIHDAGA